MEENWGEKELSFTEHFLGVRHKAVCFHARHYFPITQDAGNACRLGPEMLWVSRSEH